MSLTEVNLVCLTLSLALLVVGATGLSFSRLHANTKRPILIVATGIILWLVLTAVTVHNGWFGDAESFPPPAARIMLPSLALTLLFAFSPLGRRLAEGLTWTELVGFQAFRLPVELILYGFFYDFKIPERMTFLGANFDVLTAIGALILVPLLLRGVLGVRAIWIWNVLGLLLLINIMVIAAMSAPGGLDAFQIGVVNTLPFHFPSVWIMFCVSAALSGHLITFRKLLGARRAKASF
jgi:hypothetical protein